MSAPGTIRENSEVYRSLARGEKLLCVRNVIIYSVEKCLLSATIINIDSDDTFRISAAPDAQTNVYVNIQHPMRTRK